MDENKYNDRDEDELKEYRDDTHGKLNKIIGFYQKSFLKRTSDFWVLKLKLRHTNEDIIAKVTPFPSNRVKHMMNEVLVKEQIYSSYAKYNKPESLVPLCKTKDVFKYVDNGKTYLITTESYGGDDLVTCLSQKKSKEKRLTNKARVLIVTNVLKTTKNIIIKGGIQTLVDISLENLVVYGENYDIRHIDVEHYAKPGDKVNIYSIKNYMRSLDYNAFGKGCTGAGIDAWSLGVMIFRILFGKIPFKLPDNYHDFIMVKHYIFCDTYQWWFRVRIIIKGYDKRLPAVAFIRDVLKLLAGEIFVPEPSRKHAIEIYRRWKEIIMKHQKTLTNLNNDSGWECVADDIKRCEKETNQYWNHYETNWNEYLADYYETLRRRGFIDNMDNNVDADDNKDEYKSSKPGVPDVHDDTKAAAMVGTGDDAKGPTDDKAAADEPKYDAKDDAKDDNGNPASAQVNFGGYGLQPILEYQEYAGDWNDEQYGLNNTNNKPGIENMDENVDEYNKVNNDNNEPAYSDIPYTCDIIPEE